ncbi:MAG: glycosyltransferase family 4 protein [Patescibacteria group bacterium]|nr:glycosyltransferase family 4 protein [Patescibacteria group bacterium]
MRIVIDARMYGVKHAGIGRYVQNLVSEILKQDRENNYVLLVRKEDSNSIKYLVDSSKYPRKPKLLIAEARHYSLKEQILIPWLLWHERPDLVHFPHFNVPILYRGKFLVTIHDLLWHEMKGKDVTTLPWYLYKIKYLGYRYIFSNAVKRAQKILVPSNWIKNKLKNTYKDIDDSKIIVTYEGVDDKFSNLQKTDSLRKQISQSETTKQITKRYNLIRPYLIYTGSAYPHKNLKVLLEAVKILNTINISVYSSSKARSQTSSSRPAERDSNNNIQLLIACSRDVFWEKLQKMVREFGLEKQIRLPGFVPDEDLKNLYKNALAFVFPSLSEGFGLPGLEAMACGCPVVCSDIAVFHEIYNDAAIYFDPKDAGSLKKNVEFLINNIELKEQLIKKGLKQTKKYSWEKMSKEVLQIYESCHSL